MINAMNSLKACLLLGLAARLVSATYPTTETLLKFYEKSSCSGTGSTSTESSLLPSESDPCISGTASLKWPTVSDGSSLQVAYYNEADIPSGCSIAILQQAHVQPGDCRSAIDILAPGTGTSCTKTKLPEKGGFAMCCGGTGKGCPVIPKAGQRRSLPKRAAAANNTEIRDVTAAKRAPILERLNKRSCTFTASGSPYTGRGAQQLTSASVNCPAASSGNPCSIMHSTSITTGSSNTFGASESTSVGANDLFMSIQETVGFSYMYTYSESKSESETYTVNVPAGESGHVTWTPTVSCVDGSFPSSCNLPTKSGTACIPLYISGHSGAPSGVWNFLQEQ